MKTKSRGWFAGLAAMAVALVGLPAHAQVETTSGVARVSLINGDVSTMRGDSGDWVATTINAPMVAGDHITTGQNSRTEVQLDYADVLRLASNTEVKIAALTRTRIQLQVARGTADFVVFKGAEASSEVDTPNVSVQPLGQGIYRIDVNSEDQSEVTVRKGEADVSTPQGSTTVHKNEAINIQGTSSPEYQIARAAHRDEWDNWNRDRDRVIEDAQSWRYANRYYTGAQDLDAYGHWVDVPGYDWCWTPYVNAGWVPYRDGRWVWEPYYGWTWVSYERWGWAPYHYGRWFHWGASWVWWPGSVTPAYYPVWAPAYVSFIGFGFGRVRFGFGLGYGFNTIGWLPLGPYDPYSRWWGNGNSFNVVNITNITNVQNITNYTNIRRQRVIRTGGRTFTGSNLQAALTNTNIRRAITTVPTSDFAKGIAPRHSQPVTYTALRQANIVKGTLPVVPTRASLSPANRPAVVPAVARANAGNVRFFSMHPAPAVERSFTSQAAAVRQMVETHKTLTPASFAERGNTGTAGQVNVRQSASPAARDFRQPADSRMLPAGRPAETGSVGASGMAARTVVAGRPQVPTFSGATANARPQIESRLAPSSGIETHAAVPAVQPARPGWRRFGAPSAQSGAGTQARRSWPPAVNFGSASGTRSETAAPQPPRNVAAPAAGWHRFGNATAAASPFNSAQETRTHQARPAPPSHEMNAAPARPVPAPQEARTGWQGFAPQSRPQVSPRQEGRAPSFSRPAPEARSGNQPGWNRFTPRSAPAPETRRGGFSEPPRQQMRFPSRPESRPSYNPPRSFERAPRYERPPLQLNKPIVVGRPSHSYEAPRSARPARQAPHGRDPGRR